MLLLPLPGLKPVLCSVVVFVAVFCLLSSVLLLWLLVAHRCNTVVNNGTAVLCLVSNVDCMWQSHLFFFRLRRFVSFRVSDVLVFVLLLFCLLLTASFKLESLRTIKSKVLGL